MSRSKGYDNAAVARREREEDSRFSDVRLAHELEITDLRVRQAIKRHKELRDLLEPASATITKAIERLRATV